MKRYKGQLLLLLAAVIWGSAYIFQKMGMDYVGPFTFGFFRFTIGAAALVPVIMLMDRAAGRSRIKGKEKRGQNGGRELLIGSVLCGLTQFGAGSVQQIGLIYTTAGKAGFITSMHIVIVPLLMIFLRRRVGLFTWIGVAVAVFGMYLLCLSGTSRLQLGDGLELASALIYAIQILLIDYYAVRTEPTRLASLQFLIAGLLSGAVMLFFEDFSWSAVVACAVPILYTGLLEVAAAYTLEIFGQRTTPPAVTAIILSLEAVFSVICGALVLGEQMSGRETLDCVVMMAAFLVAQVGGLRPQKGKAG
ncbi:MAG: DMT family transporter [Anaerovoracaceae bacterium]|jgi:drug/metabolite transporter (DMT)-like permease